MRANEEVLERPVRFDVGRVEVLHVYVIKVDEALDLAMRLWSTFLCTYFKSELAAKKLWRHAHPL